MAMRSRFASEFDLALVDMPGGRPGRVFSAEGAGARVVWVEVKPWGGPAWTAGFAGPDPGRRALTALLGTPSRTGLCIVERGTAFLGDVLEPDSPDVVVTPGPVVEAMELVAEEMLLLVTPWTITGVGANGVRWTTPRIAVDSIHVDEVSDGWIKGVADPDDIEPRDFAVDLANGAFRGGSGIA